MTIESFAAHCCNFAHHLDLRIPAIVDVVGAGGKTGLILSLMAEYSAVIPTLYTTTTRICYPHPSFGASVIACDDRFMLNRLVAAAGKNLKQQRPKLVAAGLSAVPGYLSGVDPGFAECMDGEIFPLILNEADGARGMSLKFPRQGEPVHMRGAGYLIVVLGLDCLQQPIGPRTIFRWELCSSLPCLKEGAPLTPEFAAAILLHPQGVCKDWRPGEKLIVFINKVDSPELDESAAQLARILLQNELFPVERVIWGSLKFSRAGSLTTCLQ
jgi:probable selenium-dependent hydroxylase accessory protein YqeC